MLFCSVHRRRSLRVRSTASQTAPRRIFAVGDWIRTMALVAKDLISLMARGALFLKVTPCSFTRKPLASLFSKTSNFSPFSHNNSSRYSIRRTLLCMWMVYSRATTSAMAERWVGFFDDISELIDGQLSGRIEGGVAASVGDSLATKVWQRFRG